MMGLLTARNHQLMISSKLITTWSSSRGLCKQTTVSLMVKRREKINALPSVAVMEVI